MEYWGGRQVNEKPLPESFFKLSLAAAVPDADSDSLAIYSVT
ncbi:MAG: hypothetical protein ACE5NG_14470 [bacterium]